MSPTERLGVITLLLLIYATPAIAQRNASHAGKTMTELAAAVTVTIKEYRLTLEKALVAVDAELVEATQGLEERRKLHQAGHLSEEYVHEAEARWALAQRNVDEVRVAIKEADLIAAEADVHKQLAGRPSLKRGGYEDTPRIVRFNGTGRWSLEDVREKLEKLFRATFGRPLPVSAVGQTRVHDRLGLDHRSALDIAVHPDSEEGRWLRRWLREAGIPFVGLRSAVAGTSTGAHLHIGPPSPRMATR